MRPRVRSRSVRPVAPPAILAGAVYTQEQLRLALRVGMPRIRAALKAGELRFTRFGPRYLIFGESVLEWLRRRKPDEPRKVRGKAKT